MDEVTISPQNHFLQSRYESLWSASIKLLQSGGIEIDPVLSRSEVDRRRGMTLLFRPSLQIQERVVQFLSELRELEPDQYYYHPAELHVTFLSLFTATEKYETRFARAEEYVTAVDSSVCGLAPFPMFFAGITASSGAIMVRGFTDAGTLNTARDLLRRELRSRGLTQGLDERYHLETAHMTLARFRQPLRDGKTFAATLDRMRTIDFGNFEVNSLELVKNDWYMSRGYTERVLSYKLAK